MATCVAEIFSDGGTCESSVILHGSRVTGGCRHNDGVVHRSFLLKGVDDGGDSGALLSDGNIDTIDGFTCLVVGTLVDDSVDGDGGLARLTVTDDKFTLTSANRNHGIDRLQTCLQRLVDGLTEDDSWGFALQGHVESLTSDGSLTVDGVSEGIDHTSHHAFAHGDGGYASRSFYGITFLDVVGRTQQHGSHIVFLKIHYDGLHAIVECEEFTCFRIA